MPAAKSLNPLENPFGYAVRRHRARLGLTQEQLGRRVGYSGDAIGKFEKGDVAPPVELGRAFDGVFGTHGDMQQLAELTRTTTGLPSWMREWVEAEQKARKLHSWQPLNVEGLLQTEEYARAILRRQPGVTNEQIGEQLTTRMERKKILDGDDPPLLWVEMDEWVLHRQIGSPKVMHDQLQGLIEASYHSHVTIQVVPSDAPVPGLAGAFAIAHAREGLDTVYLESAGEALVTDRAATVEAVGIRFDAICSRALPVDASVELITKVMESRWKAQT